MRNNFLFDLDGTLLPMDTKYFVDLFTESFCESLVPVTNTEARTLMNAVWTSVGNMMRNVGGCLNSEVFWHTMNSICGRDMRPFNDSFDDFYRTDFDAARAATGTQPLSRACIEWIRNNGGRIILATNPVFPKSATFRRIEWAGLDPRDFEYITTYDNSSACKPHLRYYSEICSACGIRPEESLMVGNDTREDMAAAQLGMDTYLITDCLINRDNKPLSLFRHGSFEDFYGFLRERA